MLTWMTDWMLQPVCASTPIQNKSGSHTAPPPPQVPIATGPVQQPAVTNHHPPPPAPHMAAKQSSVLAANLSELDMLLNDLSSAQFLEEVDRKNGRKFEELNVVGIYPQPV